MKRISIPMPWGKRLHIAVSDRDIDQATHMAGMMFGTNLKADLYHRGKWQGSKDLGSGLVTNVGVLALANDANWSATNALNSLFAKMKYHASGKGVTGAAATDIKLETVSTLGGQTPVAGTQVLVSAANLQKYQSVATIAYSGGSENVTEWGIFSYGSTLPAVSALSDATGSPFTAGSGTSGTTTGTSLTASSATVMGQQMSIFEYTAGGLGWGLVTSNTTSVVTVPAWYKVSDGTAATAPANTNPYVIRPIMFDHKVFTAIGVTTGDSIQFTWTLTISSGG